MRACIRLHLRKAPSKAKFARRLRYDIARLKDPETSKRFGANVRNRFQVLSDTCDGLEMDIEATWRAGKEYYHYACEKMISSRRKKKKIWISTESWNLINKIRLLKEKKEGKADWEVCF